MRKETTYQKVIKNELEHDSHASDLYVKDCPVARIIVAEHKFLSSVTRFRSQIDNEIWFDIPFAYDPWWEKRTSSRQLTVNFTRRVEK